MSVNDNFLTELDVKIKADRRLSGITTTLMPLVLDILHKGPDKQHLRITVAPTRSGVGSIVTVEHGLFGGRPTSTFEEMSNQVLSHKMADLLADYTRMFDDEARMEKSRRKAYNMLEKMFQDIDGEKPVVTSDLKLVLCKSGRASLDGNRRWYNVYFSSDEMFNKWLKVMLVDDGKPEILDTLVVSRLKSPDEVKSHMRILQLAKKLDDL